MKDVHVRRGTHWIVMSLFLAVAGCSGDSGTNGGRSGGGGSHDVTTSVTVSNDYFNPSVIQVSPGATVTWTWAGGSEHNVTFVSSAVSAPSNRMATGTFQVVMPTATGVYLYDCTIHSGMAGAVTVQ